MKRINIIIASSLTLTALVCAYSQTPGPGGQNHLQKSQTVGTKSKVLVKRLPKGVEGVTLENNGVRLKRGYDFKKKSNNEVIVVARAAGGVGPGQQVSGSWSCVCETSSTGERGVGGCSASISGSTLTCVKSSQNGCNTSCSLDVTASGDKTGVIRY